VACKSNVVSNLKQARFLSTGKQRARSSWSYKARKKYGWSYRKWSKASPPKGYHVTVNGNDYLLYKVYAYGTPCN
jgi:hypothetical protein